MFVRSGFRFDYLLADKDRTFLRELCEYHVSGQLRVAPEHISDNVLSKMGKPSVNVYNAFCREFEKMNEKLGKDQYIVPQDFYPTPGTISTCMYYTGLDPTTMKGGDPSTMKAVYVPRDPHEKAMQRALIQYRDPKNYALVKEALLREGRSDLIGFGEKFLIPPRESRRATDSLSPRGISDSRKSQKSRGSQTAHDSRKPRGNSGKSGSSGRRSGPKKH